MESVVLYSVISITEKDTLQTPYEFIDVKFYKENKNDVNSRSCAVCTTENSMTGYVRLKLLDDTLKERFSYPKDVFRVIDINEGISTTTGKFVWIDCPFPAFGAVNEKGETVFDPSFAAIYVNNGMISAVSKAKSDYYTIITKNSSGEILSVQKFYYPPPDSFGESLIMMKLCDPTNSYVTADDSTAFHKSFFASIESNRLAAEGYFSVCENDENEKYVECAIVNSMLLKKAYDSQVRDTIYSDLSSKHEVIMEVGNLFVTIDRDIVSNHKNHSCVITAYDRKGNALIKQRYFIADIVFSPFVHLDILQVGTNSRGLYYKKVSEQYAALYEAFLKCCWLDYPAAEKCLNKCARSNDRNIKKAAKKNLRFIHSMVSYYGQ